MAIETQTQPPTSKSTQTFHLINTPQTTIHDALTGLTSLHPSLSYSATHKILHRADLATHRTSRVTVIGFSGGGHEPMFSGFVGPGFLSAAVSGNVFASPTAAQIYAAIRMCQPGGGGGDATGKEGKGGKGGGEQGEQEDAGTLVVCGNYTGDVLNAGLAVTRAQAAGCRVRFLPVGDDVAVGRAKGGKVGRRGLSGHLVGLKVACALAEKGEGLTRVAEVMEYVVGNVGTIGVAFDRVSLPNGILTDLPTLPPHTIELGMGAHGEPGLQQISPIPTPKALVERMIDLLVNTSDTDRAFIPFSSNPSANGDNQVVLLVNSLGSTSDEVLARFTELAIVELKARGFEVVRMTLGPLVTSLKMSGFGFTLWRLPGAKDGEVLERKQALELWDYPVDCAAWRQ
ncbi:DAK1/DegV-like protein [Viridothelium virens]|uniref:DAK1/DegV-like protein n=1 Tax=Viridothelium virens TaxID=1048519 RepID=A0A6A6HC07_VIRVR|nr:DAK1/DegV-like protein [Viridothelium virens]